MMITKTDFVEGMNCPKYVWLKKNKPELFERKELGRLAEEGIRVGMLAENCFDDTATRIPWTAEVVQRVQMTEEAIRAGQKLIAEAAFQAGNLYCQLDYLEIEDDGVIINEVKAKTSVRKTRTKNKVEYEAELEKEFLYDFGFQYQVLTMAGLNVKQVNCIHLNKEYKRSGDVEYNKLFDTEDVTAEVRKYCEDENHSIKEDINRLCGYLAMTDNLPDKLGTTRCKDCELWEHCTANLPRPNVFDLNGTYCKKRDAFYGRGLISFPELLAAEVLNEKGQMQVEAELCGTEYIDAEQIRGFLEEIRYPLYFLDFESYQNAVPVFDGQWPYEQVPFQYSLDVIAYPGADIEHHEFLGTEGFDPRRAIAESLVHIIPTDVCVTAYNMSFEGDRLKELAELFPDLEEHLLMIRNNLVDFIIPFRKFWLYKKEMQGKSTIKFVLPALFPEDDTLNYHNLPGVQRGDEAMEMFLKLPELDEAERVRQRAYMLRYCRLDTFAMIKVYEALLQAAEDPLYAGVLEATTIYAEQMRINDYEEESKLIMNEKKVLGESIERC